MHVCVCVCVCVGGWVRACVHVCVRVCKNKTKEMGVSAKTAMKQVANNGRYKNEAWQYRKLGSAQGIVLGFLRGRGRSLAFIPR